MQNLKLTDEEFQPERNVVLEERLWRTDNSPIGYLYFRLFNNAFTYHPYHWTPIGFKDDIKNWSIEDIRSFHSKYYQPANAIVVVAGDITPEVVFENVTKYFGAIKNASPIPSAHHQVEPQQDGAKRLMIKKESEVEMVAIAYKIPNFLHEDQAALSALSELLSSGKSSKLQRILVDEKKLVNQIYGYAMEAKDPSVFLFLAVCNPGVKAENVEAEILKIIESLKKGDVSDKDIEKIKINTKADFIHNLESSSELATLFGSYYAKGDISPLLNYEERINALKKEDIIKAVNKYLVQQSSTTVILRKDY